MEFTINVNINTSPKLEKILTVLTGALIQGMAITAPDEKAGKVDGEKTETETGKREMSQPHSVEDTKTKNTADTRNERPITAGGENAASEKTETTDSENTNSETKYNEKQEPASNARQEPAKGQSTVDFETLKKLFVSKIQATDKRDVIKTVLADFKAESLSELPPNSYDAVYERLKVV